MLWGNTQERTIDLANPREVAEVRDFLARFDLTFNGDVDYTVALYNDDQIIATGSLAGEVLRNIAIDEFLQGEGLTAGVVSHLMREAATRGHYHYFLFTKPAKAHLFGALGFKEVASVEPLAVLLEAGMGSIEDFCTQLAAQTSDLPQGPRAALVVNCNPFTLGHEAVIAKASRENTSVVVLVVSEDKSLFPFEVRFKLVQQGVANYNNVRVLAGGPYIISSATFPGYFTRGKDTVMAQTRLDAKIFAQYIAPALGVTSRYVGEEPYSEVTRIYNQALLDVLPQFDIEVNIMPRKQQGTEVISASRVRQLIRSDNWDEIKNMVPKTTYEYLTSAAAQVVIKNVKATQERY